MEMTYLIGTDAHPQYVSTFDINKDNQIDIVSANSKINGISVIMGYGNGSFADQIIYSTGTDSYPYAVVAADLNNDNRLDFLVVNQGTDSVGIFFGYNYTTFQSETTYSSMGNLEPFGIVVSDFNNDKYLDIATVFFGSDSLGIIFGYGSGSFSNMVIYSTGIDSQPQDLAEADFNNDGRSDIVVVNSNTSTIGVFLGYGNGSFAAILTYSTGNYSYPMAVTVSDFNNDKQLDIVVADIAIDSIGILLGYGNGTFSIVKTYSTGQGSAPFAITFGDFNNDDRLDIVVANIASNSIAVLLGYGDGTFENQMTFSTGSNSQPYWVTVGDFNSDNRLDVATANFNGDNVGILLGYGNGTFADIITYSTGAGSSPTCVEVGDFNYDNHLDIAVTGFGTKTTVVLFGYGDGSFLLGTAYSTGIGSTPVALAIADFNNDTRLDIAVANQQSNNIAVCLGNGSESFAGLTTYSTGDGSQPHLVAFSDLNNDGWLDIVIANYGTNNVGVLLGRSNTVFDPIMTYSTGTGSAPYSVAIADFDNDHHLDIVVTNSQTDNIAIFLGHGDGTFAIGATYPTGDRSRPYTVVINDFNNDNISDIAIANSGTNNILLLYGYGNGTFVNETFYPFGYGYNPYSIAVTDLNEDGWMDIVIACYNTDHIETLVKMC
jgi:streptogramin lyase